MLSAYTYTHVHTFTYILRLHTYIHTYIFIYIYTHTHKRVHTYILIITSVLCVVCCALFAVRYWCASFVVRCTCKVSTRSYVCICISAEHLPWNLLLAYIPNPDNPKPPKPTLTSFSVPFLQGRGKTFFLVDAWWCSPTPLAQWEPARQHCIIFQISIVTFPCHSCKNIIDQVLDLSSVLLMSFKRAGSLLIYYI